MLQEQRVMTLILDALFLALAITKELSDLDRRKELRPDNRLLELGRKAWARYERRRQMARVMGLGVEEA